MLARVAAQCCHGPGVCLFILSLLCRVLARRLGRMPLVLPYQLDDFFFTHASPVGSYVAAKMSGLHG